jgi:hypothetical protein
VTPAEDAVVDAHLLWENADAVTEYLREAIFELQNVIGTIEAGAVIESRELERAASQLRQGAVFAGYVRVEMGESLHRIDPSLGPFDAAKRWRGAPRAKTPAEIKSVVDKLNEPLASCATNVVPFPKPNADPVVPL